MKNSSGVPFLVIGVWLLGTLFWWGLAFYPSSVESPDWLTVARAVCFGSLADGLPDRAGWIVLILGPLSFLIAGFVAWPTDLTVAIVRGWRTRRGKFVTISILAVVGLEASWVVQRFQTAAQYENVNFANASSEDLSEDYPRTNRHIGDFTLVDQSGEIFQLADHKSEVVILTFAFAHCQTVCPTLVRQALDIENEFKSKKIRVVIVTLDPWRDTPKALPFLAEKWKLPPNAHVLSGPVDTVLSVLDQFQIPYKKDERTGDVVHPALVYVIEPGGKIAFTFNNAPNRWLRQAIERIVQNGQTATASR